MNDRYNMLIWIGIGMRISIGEIFSFIFGIKKYQKNGIGPPLMYVCVYVCISYSRI